MELEAQLAERVAERDKAEAAVDMCSAALASIYNMLRWRIDAPAGPFAVTHETLLMLGAPMDVEGAMEVIGGRWGRRVAVFAGKGGKRCLIA